jgi:hypothetical protein
MSTALTNISKISTSPGNSHKLGVLSYILTDAMDYVLVGSDEDLNLIWQEDFELSNSSKVSAALGNSAKVSASLTNPAKTSTSLTNETKI